MAHWLTLPSDEGAIFDLTVTIDAASLSPMLTYGTNPGMGVGVNQPLPNAGDFADPSERAAFEKALTYMGLSAGKSLEGQPIDVVFIGSCTNSRIEDLRAAASVFRGRKVKAGIRRLVVRGSQRV